MESQSKKNQVKHGKYGSIKHPLGSHNYQVLKTRGSKNQQRSGWDYSNFTKGETFFRNFLIWFSPLSPQAEQKQDDEQFVNDLQIYVSRTFTKAKRYVLSAEYPISSKFHLSKCKIYFFQFIDKFLKIEEVEHLIHYDKFKM